MTLDTRGFFATARERERIRQARIAGLKGPWTKDPILQQWRFCNVHREHDRTTVWFAANVRDPIDRSAFGPVDVVEATLIFRWFNRVETVAGVLGFVLNGWDSAEARRRLQHVAPLTNAAYRIWTPPGSTKLEGILGFIEHARRMIPEMVPAWGSSLQLAHQDLMTLPGLGRFMAYEVVTDLRWTNVLRGADDIETWASAGPGCARGFEWMTGDVFHYGSPTDQERLQDLMMRVLEQSRQERNWPQTWRRWEMREVEHWACEYDKYRRASGGQRLKRRYP